MKSINVRILRDSDILLISKYWLESPKEHLVGMGVDLDKLPSAKDFKEMLNKQLSLDNEHKQSYALIWEIDGNPVGHSNVNKIVHGKEAYMHLHLWDQINRKSGLGLELVKLSVRHFFEVLELDRIISEPYALNIAPNKTLKKAGFKLEKNYKTIPGSINFEQEVSRWILTRERFNTLY